MIIHEARVLGGEELNVPSHDLICRRLQAKSMLTMLTMLTILTIRERAVHIHYARVLGDDKSNVSMCREGTNFVMSFALRLGAKKNQSVAIIENVARNG